MRPSLYLAPLDTAQAPTPHHLTRMLFRIRKARTALTAAAAQLHGVDATLDTLNCHQGGLRRPCRELASELAELITAPDALDEVALSVSRLLKATNTDEQLDDIAAWASDLRDLTRRARRAAVILSHRHRTEPLATWAKQAAQVSNSEIRAVLAGLDSLVAAARSQVA